jgi:hypothetical protein
MSFISFSHIKTKKSQKYIVTDSLAIDFFNHIEGTLTIPCNNREKKSVDLLCKRIKGLDSNFGNFGDDAIYQAALGFQIHPNVSTNLNATKINLMDPTNITGKNHTYVGGVTPSHYGVRISAVNGHILSNIRQLDEADINSSSACVGFVIKENVPRFDFGTYGTNFNSGGNDANLWMRGGNTTTTLVRAYRYESNSSAATDPRGHNAINLKDTQYTASVWRNKTKLFDNNAGQARLDSYNVENNDILPFGANVFNGVIYTSGYENTIMFSHYFRGLTETMMGYWNDIVEQYIIDMERKIW